MEIALLILLLIAVIAGIIIHVRQLQNLSLKIRGLERSLIEADGNYRNLNNSLGSLRNELSSGVSRLASGINSVEAATRQIQNKNGLILELLTGINQAIAVHMRAIQAGLDKVIQLNYLSDKEALDYRTAADLRLKGLADHGQETKKILALLTTREDEHFQKLLRESLSSRDSQSSLAEQIREQRQQTTDILASYFSSSHAAFEQLREQIGAAANSLNSSADGRTARLHERSDELNRLLSELKSDHAEKFSVILQDGQQLKAAVTEAAVSAGAAIERNNQHTSAHTDRIAYAIDQMKQEVSTEGEMLRNSLGKADELTGSLRLSLQAIEGVYQLHLHLKVELQQAFEQQDGRAGRVQLLLAEKAANMEQHIKAVYKDFDLLVELLKAGLMNDLLKELNQKMAN